MNSEGGVLLGKNWDAELYGRSVNRILQAREKDITRLKDGIHAHCTQKVCGPKSEADLKLPNPLTRNVYVCRYGLVHVCSEDVCLEYRQDPHGVCPVTGIKYIVSDTSTYSSTDYRTWGLTAAMSREASRKEVKQVETVKKAPIKRRAGRKRKSEQQPSAAAPVKKPAKRKNERKRKITLEEQNNSSNAFIQKLLYSNVRVKCNQEVKASAVANATAQVQQYRRFCSDNGQLPQAETAYRIYISYIHKMPEPFVILKAEPARIAYYQRVIGHVWGVVIDYYLPHVKFNVFVIGVLYMMRTGLWYDNEHNVIPKDEYLEAHLPSAEMLNKYFGIGKETLTTGDYIIRQTYDNARKEKASIARLVFV